MLSSELTLPSSTLFFDHRKLYKLTKVFSGAGGIESKEAPLAVAEEGKAKVVAFQANLPLIAAICNPGMRERHWGVVAEVMGFEIKRDEVRGEKYPQHGFVNFALLGEHRSALASPVS